MDLLATAAQVVGALTVILGGVAMATRRGPIAWLIGELRDDHDKRHREWTIKVVSPVIDERLATLTGAIGRIEAAVGHNGGSTLHDAVAELKREQHKASEERTAIMAYITDSRA